MPPKGRASTSSRAQTSKASTSKRARKNKAPPPPPPPPLPWPFANEDQEKRYRMLAARQIIPSKSFDNFTIHNLGLRREVTTFLSNIGWIQFASMQPLTYTTITYEILSTLKSTFDPYDPSETPCITFRCLGIDRALSMNDFNAIFGFTSDGITWNVSDFDPDRTWLQLTGQTLYNPSHSKASFIRNHALRYIHRVMSMSIFGRGESTGVVNKVELLFLWAMAKGVQVNTGAWFLKHLLHVAKSPSGKICVGGLLTMIAGAYGFLPDPELHRIVEGSHLVDIDTLLNMRICRHVGNGRFRLLDATGHVLEQEEEEAEEEEEQNEPEVDLSGFPDAFTEHPPGPSTSSAPHDLNMSYITDRFDRLETRMTRSEDFQQQMLNLMQRNAEATSRIEDKLSRFP